MLLFFIARTRFILNLGKIIIRQKLQFYFVLIKIVLINENLMRRQAEFKQCAISSIRREYSLIRPQSSAEIVHSLMDQAHPQHNSKVCL